MTAHLVEAARLFATGAHAGQVRKYTNLPYITHPEAVVELVRGVPHTDEMLIAGWLHDCVEDCGVDLDTIYKTFGGTVTEMVWFLTDISKPTDGNRAHRKALDRAHLAIAPAPAQTVKLADLIDNTGSIREHDPDFAVVYFKEKRALLEVMTAGDPHLYRRAWEMIGE